ncbi:MAG: DeoR/GlpR family DNA-binding transcription regulator [Pseudomonadota bacterium]|nr:DeoR/GlpR family DNA-binding transcription regulator [Pseudomonadota bacterium]
MLGAERNRQLRRRILERGSIRVSEEAKLFGVSDETIRRAIKLFAAEGVADPVFGGAVLRASSAAPGLPPVGERHRMQERAKDAIGAAAARLVESGQTIIIDAGTTTLAAARHLRQHRGLTIITNSIPVAQLSAEIAESVTYVIGGKLVPGSLSMIGPQAERDLAKISADWAFIGAAAISVDSGFTSADPYEAEVKRAMIRVARRTVVVADHTKFGARRFASFARAEDIDCLVTTSGCPEEVPPWLEAAGVTLLLCDPLPEEITA